MRILITTLNGFRPYLRSFTDAVLARALVRRGHTVIAYTPAWGDDSPEEVQDGVLVRRVPRLNDFDAFSRSRPYLGLWRRLYRLIRFDRPDVIHLFHLRSRCNYPVTIIAQLLGIPVVLSEWGLLHDGFLVADRDRPLAAPIRYDNVIHRWLDCFKDRRWLPRHGFRTALRNYYCHYPLFAADRLVFLSQHNYDHLRHLGIPDSRIIMLPTPIDPSVWNSASSVNGEYQAASRPWIVFIGQLKLRKGFDLLVEAMRLVIQQYPQTSTFFISSNWRNNPNYTSLVASVEEHKLQHNFRFLGTVSEELKWFLLSNADALAVPSRYEGFGLPLLEAMLAGCPIVATDVVAINETIKDGYNGLLFPLEDAVALAGCLTEVIGDKELAQRLVTNGRDYVQLYDINRHVHRFEAVYEGLLT